MFETKTYEALLASALARVSSGIDKREGSMVMNGVAPSMAELAQLYIGLDFVFTATYLATAPREYLIKRAADRNMSPYPPSAAVFRAEFNIEVPVGTRFSCEDLNFVVTARMDTSDKSKGVIRFYTKVKQRQAEIAINRVIDYVNDPEKYKDYIEMRADIMMMKG